MRFRNSWIFLLILGWLTVNLAAAPCNTAPTVSPQSVFLDLAKPLMVDTLASDIDGQALAISIVDSTCPAYVSAVVDPTQTITLFSSAGAPSCQVRFQVDDGAGGTAEADLNISFDPNAIFVDGFELGSTAAW